MPDLVCCRAGYLKETDGTLKVLSTRDCEIWGIYTWNSATSDAKMLRVTNDSDTNILSIRLGFANENNSHSFQQFPIPLYAKGGIKVRSKDQGGGDDSGVAATVLFREFEHSGRELDSSGRL